jgi:hypothetical protein
VGIAVLHKHITTLPLGVDLSPHGVGIVVPYLSDGAFVIAEAHWQPCAGRAEEPWQETLRTARELLDTLETRERRCVLGLPGTEVVNKILRKPVKASAKQLASFTTLQADRFTQLPSYDRVVNGELLASDYVLLSIAPKELVDHRADIARTTGLKPLAIDLEWCAWQRALPADHAVLDVRFPEPLLSIFARSLSDTIVPGTTYSFASDVTDVEIVSKVASVCMQQRRDTGADVERLSIMATPDRYVELAEVFATVDGFHIEPVTIASRELPGWALAFGLATWSYADVEQAA